MDLATIILLVVGVALLAVGFIWNNKKKQEAAKNGTNVTAKKKNSSGF